MASKTFQGASKLSNSNLELNLDLHTRLCKKIAQLTKVIYMLNCKNDECDARIEALRATNSTELERVRDESNRRVRELEDQIDNTEDHNKQILGLEKQLSEALRSRAVVVEEFEHFKSAAEVQQEHQEHEHGVQLSRLNSEVERIRSKLAATVGELQSCRAEFEREGAAHVQQLDELSSSYAQRDTTAQTQLQNSLQVLRAEHEAEIGRLRNQIEQFEAERQKIQAECDEKLSKAQAFFEHELEVARHTANASLEGEAARSEQSRKDMERLLAEARQREERLRDRAVASEDELERARSQNRELDASVRSLHTQLDAVNEQLAAAERRLADTEALRTQNSQQLQSSLLALNDQLSTLRTQLADSERSRNASSQKAAELERSFQEQTAQITSLNETIATLRRQLEAAAESSKNLKRESSAREKQLREQSEATAARLREELEREMQKRTSQLEKQLRSRLSEKENAESEIARIIHDSARLEADLVEARAELADKSSKFQSQIAQLEASLKERSSELQTTNGQLEVARNEIIDLKSKLDQLSKDMEKSTLTSKKLKYDLDQTKQAADLQRKELAVQLERQTREHTAQSERREAELEKARGELRMLRVNGERDLEAERRAWAERLDALRAQHKEALARDTRDLQKKIDTLEKDLAQFQRRANEDAARAAKDLEAAKRNAFTEVEKLRSELLRCAQDSTAKLDQMAKAHAEKIASLEAARTRQMGEVERRLAEQFSSASNVSQLAHRATLDSMREQFERDKLAALEREREQHRKEIDAVRRELGERHMSDLSSLTKPLEQQLQAARAQLESAQDSVKSKEKEFSAKLESVQEEVRARENQLRGLREELERQKAASAALVGDLASRDRELARFKKDADKLVRQRESEIEKAHADELAAAEMRFMHDKDALLTTASRAQEMLKERLAELQVLLEEARVRYDSRESRPEDLELIADLRQRLEEQDAILKRMADEKKFFQLELVNRENNFNKMFNNQPQVGVMNPLLKRPKQKQDAKGPSTPPPAGHSVSLLQSNGASSASALQQQVVQTSITPLNMAGARALERLQGMDLDDVRASAAAAGSAANGSKASSALSTIDANGVQSQRRQSGGALNGSLASPAFRPPLPPMLPKKFLA